MGFCSLSVISCDLLIQYKPTFTSMNSSPYCGSYIPLLNVHYTTKTKSVENIRPPGNQSPSRGITIIETNLGCGTVVRIPQVGLDEI
jgi:hypothetical protein